MCENCREIKRTAQAKDKLRENNLEYIGYHDLLEDFGVIRRYVEYKCQKCGYTSSIRESTLKYEGINGCKNCRHIEVVNKYKYLLEKSNCTFISMKKRNNMSIFDILFKYNECGHEYTVPSNRLSSSGVPKCVKCQGIKREKMLHEFYKGEGFIYLRSFNCNWGECYHLFCGHVSNRSYIRAGGDKSKGYLGCKHCRAKLSLGKPKEHNKHLVEECYNILEYTLYLKQELTNKGKDISEISNHENYKFICDTLDYIEGWFDNFKAVKDKYPNGDLGTVLENNPYYLHVWNIVVPALEGLLEYDS